MIVCPNCGSTNVSVQLAQTMVKNKAYGAGPMGKVINLVRWLLVPFTLGLSLLFIKRRVGKGKASIENRRVFVCQNCGEVFNEPATAVASVSGGERSLLKEGGARVARKMREAMWGDEASDEEMSSTGAPIPCVIDYTSPEVRRAVAEAIKQGWFSISHIQNLLQKDYTYVAQLADFLERYGVIGELYAGTDSRPVRIGSIEQFDNWVRQQAGQGSSGQNSA